MLKVYTYIGIARLAPKNEGLVVKKNRGGGSKCYPPNGPPREIKEGCPLPSEVNGDSKSTNERGPSFVGS
jgi:hypothetical protein